MTLHILDLQMLVAEDQEVSLNSNVSVLACPTCPSTPSLLVCC